MNYDLMLDTPDYPRDPSGAFRLDSLDRSLDEYLAVTSDYHQRIRQVVADGREQDAEALAELLELKELSDFARSVRNDQLRRAGLPGRVRS